MSYSNYSPLPIGYKNDTFIATVDGLGITELEPDGTMQKIVMPSNKSCKGFGIQVRTTEALTYDPETDNQRFLFSPFSSGGILVPYLGIFQEIGKQALSTIGYVQSAASATHRIHVFLIT